MSEKIYLKSERGEAGFKLVLFLIFLFLLVFAGYNYVPVAYQAANFRQEMESAVIKAVALPGQKMTPIDSARQRLRRAMNDSGIPQNSFMDVRDVKGVIQARVYYQKKVGILPFGIYNYNYVFDYTATPTGFLFKDS